MSWQYFVSKLKGNVHICGFFSITQHHSKFPFAWIMLSVVRCFLPVSRLTHKHDIRSYSIVEKYNSAKYIVPKKKSHHVSILIYNPNWNIQSNRYSNTQISELIDRFGSWLNFLTYFLPWCWWPYAILRCSFHIYVWQ